MPGAPKKGLSHMRQALFLFFRQRVGQCQFCAVFEGDGREVEFAGHAVQGLRTDEAVL